MIYDLIIIGGGIHGAACAREAAQQGYKVLVLEQYEKPGLGTSSKSSKLIHGGLRYLESGQFKLVRECLQERKHLLASAPELVKLVPFYIPVYTESRRSSWRIWLGLVIYSLFSGKGFKIIPRHQWQTLDNIKTGNLKTVFQYYDAQTNDQQLTEKVITQAQHLGTHIETSALFTSAECSKDYCTISYLKNQQHKTINSRLIINAAGPWANQILQKITPAQTIRDVDLVLGTHIVVANQLQQGMYYLESPTDGRAVFVMPWQGQTMIGTTEHFFNHSPDMVEPPETDISYLIDVYNHYFNQPVTRSQVSDAFAGLRVLPKQTGNIFSRPRNTIIHYDRLKPVVFTLYGGKLTAHRATARQVIAVVNKFLK
ncbi:MAG: FAD-dependent oxidoreductase [Gammaproteobacteria bacterium]|nr:FAD-dependent oxidoreductase [Gammaproteobacteria bacterium]